MDGGKFLNAESILINSKNALSEGVIEYILVSELRKFNFLIFNQNICCGYSKEPSQ